MVKSTIKSTQFWFVLWIIILEREPLTLVAYSFVKLHVMLFYLQATDLLISAQNFCKKQSQVKKREKGSLTVWHSYTGRVSQKKKKKNARSLIWCKLNRTVLTRSAFTFSESSYFNLKFGIKQSKIRWKFAKQWLTKAKFLDSLMTNNPNFSRNALI